MVQRYNKRNRDPRYQAPEPKDPFALWFMAAVFLFAILILSGCSAYAQEVQLACGPIEQVLDSLEHQFGETLQYQQVVDSITYELWGNEYTGTWTLLLYPDGESVCIVEDGVVATPGVYI